MGAFLWRCCGLGSLLCMEAKEAKISYATEHLDIARYQQLQELKMVLERLGCRIIHEQAHDDLEKIIIDIGSCTALQSASSLTVSSSPNSETVALLNASSTTAVYMATAQNTQLMQETMQPLQTEACTSSCEVDGSGKDALEIMHPAVQNSQQSKHHNSTHKHISQQHYRPPTPLPVDPYTQVAVLGTPVSSDECSCCCIQ